VESPKLIREAPDHAPASPSPVSGDKWIDLPASIGPASPARELRSATEADRERRFEDTPVTVAGAPTAKER
jgi:hypothetical protein